MSYITGFRDPLDPLGENTDFEDDEDGRTIVGTVIFKTTQSLIRVSIYFMKVCKDTMANSPSAFMFLANNVFRVW